MAERMSDTQFQAISEINLLEDDYTIMELYKVFAEARRARASESALQSQLAAAERQRDEAEKRCEAYFDAITSHGVHINVLKERLANAELRVRERDARIVSLEAENARLRERIVLVAKAYVRRAQNPEWYDDNLTAMRAVEEFETGAALAPQETKHAGDECTSAISDHDAEVLPELRAACNKAHIAESVPVAAGTLRVLLDTFAASRERKQAAMAWRAVCAMMPKFFVELSEWSGDVCKSECSIAGIVYCGDTLEAAVLAAADACVPGWRESRNA